MTREEITNIFNEWKNGDKSSYNKLYKEMYEVVLGNVKKNLNEKDQDQADDISQDIMVKVYKSVDSLKETDKYEEWLAGIVNEQMKDRIKNQEKGDSEKKTDHTLQSAEEANKTEEQAKTVSGTDKKNDKAPRHSFNKRIIAGIVGIFAVVVIAIMYLFPSTPTIDLDKYTTVTYEGYDGYGTASVNVDWSKIEEDYKGKIKFTKDANDKFKALFGDSGISMDDLYGPEEILELYINYDIDKTDELKNGDTVNLKWDINESYSEGINVKVKAEDKEFKVQDLKEVKTKDIFKDLEVSFSGIAPDGTLSYNYTGKDLDTYNFIADNSYNLSNGDKVKITLKIENMSDFADKNGYLPKEMEKEYTVSGLAEYVTKISEVSDNAKEYMKGEADDIITAWTASSKDDDSAHVVTASEYVGDFILGAKNMSSAWHKNTYYMIYKVTYEANDNYGGIILNNSTDAGDYYVVIGYDDVSVYDNGAYEVDTSSHEGTALYPGWTSKDRLGYASLADLKNDVIDTEAGDYTCDGWNY